MYCSPDYLFQYVTLTIAAHPDSGISSKSKKKLQIFQNKIIRFILGLHNRAHVDQETQNSVKFLSIKDRASQLRLKHAFSIFHNTCPDYLKTHFIRPASVHTHRTRSSGYVFLVPRVKGIAVNTGLLLHYNAFSDWNKLPSSIQCIPSKTLFKKSVKMHLADASLSEDQYW